MLRYTARSSSRRYSNVLDSDGQKFLGFLTEGGRRLATLIDDLLAYTRAGAVEGPLGTRERGRRSCNKHWPALAEAIRESDAIVTADPLPEVYVGEAAPPAGISEPDRQRSQISDARSTAHPHPGIQPGRRVAFCSPRQRNWDRSSI